MRPMVRNFSVRTRFFSVSNNSSRRCTRWMSADDDALAADLQRAPFGAFQAGRRLGDARRFHHGRWRRSKTGVLQFIFAKRPAAKSGVALRFPPQSMTRLGSPRPSRRRAPFWSAVAERSGDTAIERARRLKITTRLVRAKAIQRCRLGTTSMPSVDSRKDGGIGHAPFDSCVIQSQTPARRHRNTPSSSDWAIHCASTCRPCWANNFSTRSGV